ncbi:MAG TPA: hypothetical protein VGP06_00265 [Janthinobacterium sp.]|nr:hypothetical protein [Janthinobacterium sp.]
MVISILGDSRAMGGSFSTPQMFATRDRAATLLQFAVQNEVVGAKASLDQLQKIKLKK